MINTKIIITVLVKDEAWMLDRFLASCSTFADHIIVSDESTGLDDSLNIYTKYQKVILHKNLSPSSDHNTAQYRRQFVFNEARKINCDKRIIIALDSDEILSANIFESTEWKTVLNAEPGTLIHLQWVSLWNNIHYYRTDNILSYGLYNRHIWIDDNVSEIPNVGYGSFHMAYNPLQAKRHIFLNEIVCLHYQFCNWHRMESKHRYYRVQEKVIICKLSDLAIYRIYGWMNAKKGYLILPSLKEWFLGWTKRGIDVSSSESIFFTHFDLSVIKNFQKFGVEKFLLQDIWRTDWVKLITYAKDVGLISNNFEFKLPKRNILTKLYHLYMNKTIDIKFFRYIERLLLKKDFEYDK